LLYRARGGVPGAVLAQGCSRGRDAVARSGGLSDRDDRPLRAAPVRGPVSPEEMDDLLSADLPSQLPSRSEIRSLDRLHWNSFRAPREFVEGRGSDGNGSDGIGGDHRRRSASATRSTMTRLLTGFVRKPCAPAA